MFVEKLIGLGIKSHLKGFFYLNRALEYYVPNQNIMQLYEDIAQDFDVTSINVEKSIRKAIASAGLHITSKEFITKYKILWKDVK